jgi:hypothetical protein
MTTKNADMPAMPQTNEDNMCRMTGIPKPLHSGLTKREMFAIAAMQGLLAKHGDDDYSSDSIAKYAVAHADALLKELENTNERD